MASLSTVIKITHPKNNVNEWRLDHAAKEAREQAVRVAELFERIACGLEPCTYTTATAGTILASATGTVTISSGSGSITATINGVGVAITWATSDTNSAALLAAAINASVSALVKNLVTATSALGVVTITAFQAGKVGNCITLAASGTGATASGARLTGGTGDDVAPTAFDRS